MKSFKQWMEVRTLTNQPMDDIEAGKLSDFSHRDDQLQNNAKWDLRRLFGDPKKAIEVLSNPEVRKRLIPMIEKDPLMRRLISQLSGNVDFGQSSLVHRQSSDDGNVPTDHHWVPNTRNSY